jgi:glycosyltransferase involved in cell wall biosynthesis
MSNLEPCCAANGRLADGAEVISLSPDLSVIMPIYNEEATVAAIITRVLQQSCVRQVVVIDDASTDNTWRELERLSVADSRIVKVRHASNRGKGAAIRSGLQHVLAPVTIIQDADLEYDPSDYSSMLKLIVQGGADVVYGSRFLKAQVNHNPAWHTAGNRWLTFISNWATGLRLTDEATCYKMFRSDILGKIILEENGFGFCPEITAKVSRLNLRIAEVPVSYHGRTRAEGKKIRLRDGFHAIRCIVQYNFFPKR